MSIRSAAQLDWLLDQRLSWRKKELTGLKFAVEITPENHAPVIRRAAVALLYAHWEGFVREAGSAYLELVARQRKTQGELADNFIALARRSSLKQLAASNRVSQHSAIINTIRHGDTDMMRIPWRGVVSTRGNLKFGVLRELLETLGLEERPYSIMAKPIIDALVNRRNGIAHGEGLPVSEGDYRHFHNGTISLLDTFRDQVSNAAAGKEYLVSEGGASQQRLGADAKLVPRPPRRSS